MAVQTDALRAFERYTDHRGVSPGGHDPVMLKLFSVAVEDEVYSRINAAVLDSPEVGNVGVPLAWLASSEVVALAGQCVYASQRWFPAHGAELHTQRHGLRASRKLPQPCSPQFRQRCEGNL